MTAPTPICPVCRGLDDAKSKITPMADDFRVECQACGAFVFTLEAWEDELDPEGAHASKWSPYLRAALSHGLRARLDVPSHPQRTDLALLTEAALAQFRAGGPRLPSPARVVENIIRLVGNHEHETGEPLKRAPPGFYALIGAANPEAANRRFVQAHVSGVLTAIAGDRKDPEFLDAALMLEG